jgi:nitric oxide synthase oxygenase domain/subunit/sulfite reductase alpha subunit-like flavoprotein
MASENTNAIEYDDDALFRAFQQEAETAFEALAEFAIPLSDKDKVLVSEAWNRFLGAHDVFLEAVALRWLWVTQPEGNLRRALDSRVHDLRELLLGVLDLAVRSLNPDLQETHHEAYPPVHPDARRECQALTEYFRLFSELGFRPLWWVDLIEVVRWASATYFPSKREVESEDLDNGQTASALGRFIAVQVAQPAIKDALEMRVGYQAPVFGDAGLLGHWHEHLRTDAERATLGQKFYQLLFDRHPVLLDYFKTADMDRLSLHVIQSVELVLTGARDIGEFESNSRNALRHLAHVHRELLIPTWTYPLIGPVMVDLVGFEDRGAISKAAMIDAFTRVYGYVVRMMTHPMIREERLIRDAETWFDLLAKEWRWLPEKLQQRMLEVKLEVSATGTYTHTSEELQYGAQVAWRNSAKCIGRISWNTLVVRDRRHVSEPTEVFHEVLEHLKLATGGTNLLSVMTVFRPRAPDELVGMRFWNSQFVRYAGYAGEGENGDMLGDPANAEFTKYLIAKGLWTPPATKSPFDVLPLVIQIPGRADPFVYQLPEDFVHQAPIVHPHHPKFTDLGLRWPTVPAITNFQMDIGGVSYNCVPFNGWFMELEVVRNLVERYQVSEKVAEAIGIPTTEKLWQNRVFHEVAVAVLHSFEAAKFTMVDQHTAQASFLTHCERERDAGRECPAEWSWIGGMVGPGLNPLWHRPMRDFKIDGPEFRYCCDIWCTQDLSHGKLHAELVNSAAAGAAAAVAKPRVLILYGSETGTAESVANRVARSLRLLRPTLAPLNDFADDEVRQTIAQRYGKVLVVTSTFGTGQPPGNAAKFAASPLPQGCLEGLEHAVLALGSSIYPDFVAYGRAVERELKAAGSKELFSLTVADEAKGNVGTIRDWLTLIERILLPPSLRSALEGEALVRLGSDARPPVLQVRWGTPAGGGAGDPLDVVFPEGGSVPRVLNQELLDGGDVESRSTRMIAFEFPPEQTYATGDHLAVQPLNDRDLVMRFVKVLDLQDHLADDFTVVMNDNGDEYPASMPFKMPATLGHVLRTSLDFAVRPDAVADWMELASRSFGSNRGNLAMQIAHWLKMLQPQVSSAEDRESVCNEVRDYYPNVVLLLEALAAQGIALAFEAVLPLLSRLSPRYYSISSSSRMFPHRPHITVGVLHEKTTQNVAIRGICSNYLARVKPGERVVVSIRQSTFRAPKDSRAPTILVGPGTGYAPMHGFLQDRALLLEQDQDSLGPCHLFSGCRVARDRIYAQEIDAWARRGNVVSDLHLALSRADPKRRVYVQTLMREMGRDLADLLLNDSTHYYVCGDAKMADACFEACVDVLIAHADMSRVMAVRHIHLMRAAGRWQLDVWGIVESFRESRSEMIKNKNQAARVWLKHFAINKEAEG